MNQNIYRVIYNTALACWQVASEHTASKGKTKSQANRETDTTGLIPRNLHKTQLYLSLAIAGLIGMGQVHAADVAGIVVDAAQTGNKPTVSIAEKNNVPVINITAPNAAGVSKNYFTDYNVPTQGIILNNTAAGSVTKLGGATAGNLPLGTQSASLIINQVTGTKSSLIEGNHEVAGKAANLVIANPYGITVNGSAPVRFINSSQVTLTTGRPTYTTDGGLDGYNVSGGWLKINGKGIDSKANARLDLIGRAASITSDIRADGQQLNLITGANVVKSDLSDITVKATTTHPAYAIDVSELGGMYAGQMNIIATEQGVGVNNKGYIALSQSKLGNDASLFIDVNGNLNNTGIISAGTRVEALDAIRTEIVDLQTVVAQKQEKINQIQKQLADYEALSTSSSGTVADDSAVADLLEGLTPEQVQAIITQTQKEANTLIAQIQTEITQAQKTGVINQGIVVDPTSDAVKKRFNTQTVAAGQLSINTSNDLNNTGGQITGNEVRLYAGGNINNISTIKEEKFKDINSTAPTVTRTAQTLCTTQGDCWTKYTDKQTPATYKSSVDKVAVIKAFGTDQKQTYTNVDGETVTYTSNPLDISADGDLNLNASGIASINGSAKIYANNINLNAINTVDAINDIANSDNYTKTSTEVEVGSAINAKGNLLLSASSDINSRAGNISSETGETVLLGNKINIETGLAIKDFNDAHKHKHYNKLGIHTSTRYWGSSYHAEDSVAATVTGNTVTMAADNGITVRGADVFGSAGVDLYTAQGDINIGASKTIHDEASYSGKDSKYSFHIGWDGLSFGRESTYNSSEGGKTAFSGANIASNIGNIGLVAGNGNVNIATGERLTRDDYGNLQASAAGVNTIDGNVNLSGKRISVMDLNDNSWSKLTTKYSFTGLKIKMNSPILDAVNMGRTLYGQAQNASSDTQKGAVAVSGALAAYNSFRGLTDMKNMASSLSYEKATTVMKSDTGATPIVGLSVSVGRDTFFSESYENRSIGVASNVTAGGKITLNALGADKVDADTAIATTGSDIYIQGSNVIGQSGTELNAQDDINIIAGRSIINTSQTTKSTSASVGVSAGISSDGIGVSANLNYNGSKGYTSSEELINNEAYVGSNTSTTVLNAGDDVSISGSQVIGNKVIADIKGNLLIRSLQDRYKYDSNKKSFGVGVSIPIAGYTKASASFNTGNETINSDYRSVVEQAGIYSGSDGHDLKVAGNTYLTSAAIYSTSTTTPKNLMTRALVVNPNLVNSAAYTAKAMNIGATISYNMGASGGWGFTPSLPSTANASDSNSAQAVSTIVGDVTGNTLIRGTLRTLGSTTFNGAMDLGVGATLMSNGSLSFNGTVKADPSALIYANKNLVYKNAENLGTANWTGRVSTSMYDPLKQIFDLKKIQTGFDIASTLGGNLSTFIGYKLQDIQTAGEKTVIVNGKTAKISDIAKNPDAYTGLDAATVQAVNDYLTMQRQWGFGGWGRIGLTSVVGAFSGNVAGSTGQLIKDASVNVLQQYAAQGNKWLADQINNPILSEAARTALHTLTSCGAAAVKGADCSAAAQAAAATVVFNNVYSALFNKDPKTMTEQEKDAQSKWAQMWAIGLAIGTGENAAAGQWNAVVEVENNRLFSPTEIRVIRSYTDNFKNFLRKRGYSERDVDMAQKILSQYFADRVDQNMQSTANSTGNTWTGVVAEFLRTDASDMSKSLFVANSDAFRDGSLNAENYNTPDMVQFAKENLGLVVIGSNPNAEALKLYEQYVNDRTEANLFILENLPWVRIARVAGAPRAIVTIIKAANGQGTDPKSSTTKPATKYTIQDRRVHHNGKVTETKLEYTKLGYEVKESVNFCGAGGRCVSDIAIKDPKTNRIIMIIEVKTGGADLSTNQSKIYPMVANGDARPTGQVAKDFGLNVNLTLREQGYPNGIEVQLRHFDGLK